MENESRNEVREANVVASGMYWISIIYREAGANCDRSSRKKRAVSSFNAVGRRRYRILLRQDGKKRRDEGIDESLEGDTGLPWNENAAIAKRRAHT